MSDRHDYLALDWVRGEIQETLNQAQQALEAFVENPNDSTRMRFCQTHLHQVYGTLQMVEFYGAALLAEEMEKLARALVDRRVGNVSDGQETLMRAILQLPPYLDRVASNRRDLPVVLLPLLNDLRAARGEALLSETALFKPDMREAEGRGRVPDAVRDDPRFGQLARKIRQMFQLALVGLMRNDDTERNLGYMRKVFAKLEQVTGEAARAPLWRIADGLAEGLQEEVISLGSSVKQILGQVDRTLRELAAEGADSLERPAPPELLKNLLYYIAKAEHDSPRIREVRAGFRLDEALPSDDLVNAERERMTGPDAVAMGSVVSALSEEITQVKDALERFVHEGDSDPASLEPQTIRLKQVSDTVAMLGLGQPRALVEEQLKVMEDIVGRRRPAQRDTLMDVAGALLYVEATLAGIGGDNRRPAPLTGDALPSHVGQAMDAVLRECRAGLEEAKDGIVEFIASQWDRAHLRPVPERLNAVRGGLEVVQLTRPADILRQCVRFVEERLMPGEANPDWRSMDTLADAITSVEYYLERLSDDPETRDDILDLARASVGDLGYPLPEADDEPEVTEAPDDDAGDTTDQEAEEAIDDTPGHSADEPALEPEADTGDDDDLIDDEIIEIFVEEAGEVLEALDQYFPRWAANTSDQTALVEFRRAFHTLKGSGRMVGATTVGELAWSIENMMNRVIDRSIEPDATLIELVRTVHGLIPALVDAFAKRQPPPFDVAPLEEAAFTLADGGKLDRVPRIDGDLADEPAPPETAAGPDAPTDEDDDGEEITLSAFEPAPSPTDPDPLADLDGLEFELPPEQPARAGDEPAAEDADPVLLDIFRSEAERNLALVSQWLDSLDPHLSEHPVDDQVHRALHTLKGSARMAEINAVAELAEPAEKLVKELINGGRRADDELVTLIREAHEQLRRGLTDLGDGPVTLPDAPPLIARLLAAREALNEDSEGTDPHILSVFLSEGMDLIIDTDNLLEQWAADPGHTAELARLRDELELLANSASTAGLDEIHGLARALATVYSAVNQGRLGFSDRLLELAREGHEALMNMMDCLAAGQTVRAELGLVDALRDLAETPGPGGPGGGPAAADTWPANGEGDAPAPPSDGPRADLDPELTALFLEEAEDLLLAASEHLAAWEQGEADSRLALQRDLHTLKGGARMAAVTPVADLAHELENLYEVAGGPDRPAPAPSLFDVLHRGHDRLADMIDALRQGRAPAPAPDVVETLSRAALNPAAPAAPESPAAVPETDPAAEPAPERDPELVAIFLEEANDILESAGQSLETWIAEPGNTLELQALQRDLHTLKGGARMAEVTELGDLGHELETLYEALGLERVATRPALFDLLHRCHDRLAEMVEAVTAERPLTPADHLIRAVHDYLNDPDGFQLPPAAAPAPETAEPAPPEPAPAPSTEPAEDALPDEVDAEILDVFLEESEELAEIIDGCLTAWRDHPESRDFSDDLKRALHTLKGGARLAGLNDLGEESHRLESLITRLESQRRDPEENDFEAMLGHFDAINQRLAALRDAIARRPAPAGPPATVEAEHPAGGQPRREERRPQAQPQEMVRVGADVLEALVNLAGETSINRSRVEQSISEFGFNVAEMGATVTRLYEQLRRLDVETEAQILSNYQKGVDRGEFDDKFDPLEMDQYSELHQITKQLSESASDLLDLKNTLLDRTRDTETLLLQQQRVNTDLQEKLMRTRMVPFSRLVPRLRRIVRQISGELSKRVTFDVLNPEGELDRTLMERVVAPLEHMLRNAVDHGIELPERRREAGKEEGGHISLELAREGGEVVLTLADDGRGIDTEAVRRKAIERGLMTEDAQLPDHEIQQFIFHAGFSTASQVTQVSGRGVGMDVVASEIKQLGGSVIIDSQPGKGTRFLVRLPFTLAMNRALMVRVGEDAYAIPLSQIEGIVRASPYELSDYLEHAGDGEAPAYHYAGQAYDLSYLGRFVHDTRAPNLENQTQPLPVLLIRSADHSVALVVDTLIGSREVVVKSVGPQLASVAGISGATILGDGAVVIILDIHSLIRAAQAQQKALPERAPEPAADVPVLEDEDEGRAAPLIMVVDDSVTVRKVTGRLLERSGFEVITAKDGIDAIATLEEKTPDAMLLDIEMPRMDGFEVATHMRHDDRLRAVPIIMITSRTGEKHRERAFDIGVNAYMGKPFQENELLSTLRELLGETGEIRA
ncbi:MAG: hybrid sensor histidine kinase/response regulator [Alcanivorax sp.]|nr:Hpt domain-containing protein [Alcanivorax sp. ZXX171]MBU59157.1 hybrid sensor histidine kinase/response regulator [Alcanivorax sp.]HCE41801.1 hybrid sensor histidine kinase/response regulator [Alcanivorax sp.]|tara:strand:+ start:25692 stop:32258 length:6567 start_codon:yes stop_codon:yes gene_type:complete